MCGWVDEEYIMFIWAVGIMFCYGFGFFLFLFFFSWSGVAHKNNKVTQQKIAEEQAIPTLVQLLAKPPNENIQVQVAFTLGCVVLSNRDNQEKLREETEFKFKILLDLLHRPDEVGREIEKTPQRNLQETFLLCYYCCSLIFLWLMIICLLIVVVVFTECSSERWFSSGYFCI